MIILARESGLKLELSDIPVQNLVPEPLRVRTNFVNHREIYRVHKYTFDMDIPMILLQASASAEEFLQQLPQYDQDMTNNRQVAEDAGEVSIFNTLLV